MLSIEDSKTRWEFFQKHQWVSPEFSDSPVFHSWQRCVKQMNAYDWSRPHIASGFTLASLKRRTERVINCAVTVVEDTYDLLREEKLLLLVTDDNGCVMFTIGHPELESKMEALGIKVGCFLSEDKIGTNAVSFAIDTNMPCEVFAGDHFKRELHDIASAAAPVIDTFGKLRGTIMLVRHAGEYMRENLAIASSCAKEVSLQLHIQNEQENMNRLQSAHSAALEYMDDGIISWDGENLISYISHQTEKLLSVHGNDLLERDIFTVIRFAPNILSSIKQGEMVRRRQTTFEIDGRFIEAIVTYRCISDGIHLLFIHPLDKFREMIQQQVVGSAKYTFDSLPVVSQQMKHVIKVARRALKTQAPILITGEEGVGKTGLAMAIHNESAYGEGPFITLNCRSTNPHQLLRDVLGSDEGEGQLSKFELAQNGTLYVENIELLGPELQAALLKLLKTGLVSRSDSQRLISVKFQLITSTTVNIGDQVSQGSFSRQLYYDISANELHVPPIRKRKEDIEHMILKLLSNYEQRHHVAIEVDKKVKEALLNFHWSGNNSELRNHIERILLNRSSNYIELEDIPDEIRLYSPQESVVTISVMTLEDVEKQAIIEAWRVYGGRMQEMAKALDIGRTTLWRKVKKYQLVDMMESD
ncbi:dihydroxyacetone kinase operon transcriptional regulator DhaR (plasmid) [Photobacterium sp. DA100]|uniref:dihydroxyacetone kinase operon transcriptional regulator DhaR n=1 Tax=Photobacterium sp. DA100 TaxID=3027472 RepID=UPI00247B1D63|nr:dihydroxyacetone kinase operon transcriptional regulator DhaR [Photobacterium sp. DA100]WEM44848.1 dihydroxyacetone kinase operon transcriptional regulator DhaR [Photobacterium sp. DA100]